jgi:hypothetical protein
MAAGAQERDIELKKMESFEAPDCDLNETLNKDARVVFKPSPCCQFRSLKFIASKRGSLLTDILLPVKNFLRCDAEWVQVDVFRARSGSALFVFSTGCVEAQPFPSFSLLHAIHDVFSPEITIKALASQ